MTIKLAEVCCDRLLLARSANFIILTFVVVRHGIFLVKLFEAPLPVLPGGGNCKLFSPLVTPRPSML